MLHALRSFSRRLQQVIGSPVVVVSVGEVCFSLLGFRGRRAALSGNRRSRILIVKLDAVGDFVLVTPFLRELRAGFPEAFITMIVKPGVKNLAETSPYVDEVRTFECRITGSLSWLRRHWKAFAYARRFLWRRRFDIAICPRWSADIDHAGFLAYFCGAAKRITSSELVTPEKRLLNRGYDRMFTRVVGSTAPRHDVMQNLEILRTMGVAVRATECELWLTEHDLRRSVEILERTGDGGSSAFISLGLGAGSPHRTWPLTRFVELARAIMKVFPATFVLIGGQGEQALGRAFRHEFGEDAVIDLTGRLTLRETIAILKKCRLHIGNDSGPMHLAAAAGVSAVEISCHPLTGAPDADNSPIRFGPWGVDSAIVQPPYPLGNCVRQCERPEPHCVLSVSVQDVFKAVTQLLGNLGL